MSARAERIAAAARRRHRVQKLGEALRALGDPTRVRIVAELARSERSVTALAAAVGASQSAISHSLGVLRRLHLVGARREGRVTYYAVDHGVLRVIDAGFRLLELGAGLGAMSRGRRARPS